MNVCRLFVSPFAIGVLNVFDITTFVFGGWCFHRWANTGFDFIANSLMANEIDSYRMSEFDGAVGIPWRGSTITLLGVKGKGCGGEVHLELVIETLCKTTMVHFRRIQEKDGYGGLVMTDFTEKDMSQIDYEIKSPTYPIEQFRTEELLSIVESKAYQTVDESSGELKIHPRRIEKISPLGESMLVFLWKVAQKDNICDMAPNCASYLIEILVSAKVLNSKEVGVVYASPRSLINTLHFSHFYNKARKILKIENIEDEPMCCSFKEDKLLFNNLI